MPSKRTDNSGEPPAIINNATSIIRRHCTDTIAVLYAPSTPCTFKYLGQVTRFVELVDRIDQSAFIELSGCLPGFTRRPGRHRQRIRVKGIRHSFFVTGFLPGIAPRAISFFLPVRSSFGVSCIITYLIMLIVNPCSSGPQNCHQSFTY